MIKEQQSCRIELDLNFNFNDIELMGVFYIDQLYSSKHVHMVHKHKNILELLYVASGEGRYIVGNREYAVHQGDMVICNADTLHGEAPFQSHSIQTYCIALANVKFSQMGIGCLIAKEQRPVIAMENFEEMVRQIMFKIYELSIGERKATVLCRQLSLSILSTVQQLLFERGQQGSYITEQKNEKLVRLVTNYLDNHYMEEITLEKISKSLHISVSHLSHLFKRETGLSPMQYVIHRRLGEAQSLLAETQIPIKNIEERLGFSSSCHLSALFKKYVGLSPREYRRYFKK